jgi:hypothetical protein
LANELSELARHGVTVRICREGSEYEQEQKRGGRYEPTTNVFRRESNIHIRVKPPSRRTLMHLKGYEIDNVPLRDDDCHSNDNVTTVGRINWPRAAEEALLSVALISGLLACWNHNLAENAD